MTDRKKESIFTLITGASRGLGREIALQCAKRSQDLLLVSLPDEGMEELAENIRVQYDVRVFTFETDLTNRSQLTGLISFIKSNFLINCLINNAGIGGTMRFSEVDEQYLDRILQVNIHALVYLSQRLFPLLSRHPKAYILNISSMASYGPMPFKTIYPASKAFVRSFSKGLSEELKDTNIQVSVACPGGMPTNSEVRNRIMQHNSLVRQTILSPKEVAKICIEEMFRGKKEIIPGRIGKLCWLFIKLCPDWIRMPLVRKNVLREIQREKELKHA